MSRYRGGGSDTGEILSNMSNAVHTMSNATRMGVQNEQAHMDLENERRVNAAYDYIAKKMSTGGDISALEADPVLSSRHGVQGFGKYMQDRAVGEESRLQLLKSMTQGQDEFYRNHFRPAAGMALEAYEKGDMQAFLQGTAALSHKMPMPFKYSVGPDGNLIQHFRSNKDGGYVDTGRRIAPQDVYNELKSLMDGEVKILSGASMQVLPYNANFMAAVGRFKMGTHLSNAEAMSDPGQWIPLTRNGHTVYAIPQNRHDDYLSGPAYRILDEGRGSYMVGSMQDMLDKGYVQSAVKASAARFAGAGGKQQGVAIQEVFRQRMRELGYMYDKTQGGYYKGKEDMDGKWIADFSQPATTAFMNEVKNGLVRQGGAEGGSGLMSRLAENEAARRGGDGVPTKDDKENVNQLSKFIINQTREINRPHSALVGLAFNQDNMPSDPHIGYNPNHKSYEPYVKPTPVGPHRRALFQPSKDNEYTPELIYPKRNQKQ